MNDQFDELAKGLAQSVTRRGALKKFGVGLAGIALASLGLPSNAEADPGKGKGRGNCDHCNPASNFGCSLNDPNYVTCYNWCYAKCFNTGGG